MFAVSNVAYADCEDFSQIIEAAKQFTLNVDQMLHIFTNFEGYLTANTIKPKLSLVERQFLSNLKVFPTSLHERIRRNCNFHVEMNLSLLNDLETIVNIDSWEDASSELINLLLPNEGRELPLLNIEKQLKVNINSWVITLIICIRKELKLMKSLSMMNYRKLWIFEFPLNLAVNWKSHQLMSSSTLIFSG